ncbi:MAG: DUF3107 domain-containing protein [Arthrobacter sp.]|jgi:hypothetical protein|nr:DUF3107 domain-containing protein [Arthrobacter sp.]
MDVRIGMKDVAREVAIETEDSAEAVEAAIAAAIKDSSLLSLTDSKGRKVLVAGAGIAYVEFGAPAQRPVGFAQA